MTSNASTNRWYVGTKPRECMVWCDSYEAALNARCELDKAFTNVRIYNVKDNGMPCVVYIGA